MISRATVITPPEPLLSLDLAKQHLRVTSSEEDALIQAYIDAVSANLDGPGGWLDRAISPQTLELRKDDFIANGSRTIDLPYQPIIDVVSVKYLDSAGAEQTLDPSDYSLTGGWTLQEAFDTTWPTVLGFSDAVRIQYRAGYAVDATEDPLVPAIPPAVTAAALLMLGDLYENRETTAEGLTSAIPMSTTSERLLAPYRVWAI